MSDRSPEVIVYRTRGCPFCVGAEHMLRELGVAHEEVFLDDRPDRRQFTASIKPGHTTVPLIVIDGTPLGGLDDLRHAAASGELDRLLGRTPS